MPELTFDEERHVYLLDGAVLPSVTTIISPLVDLSAIDPDILERARMFGTAVHMTAELHDKGILDMSTVDAPLMPYLEAWQRFMRECGWQNEEIEGRVVHPVYRYAGTFDRVGTINKRGRRVRGILDIKTGSEVGDSVGVQLAAYQNAYNYQHPTAKTITRWSVRLTEDRKYKLDEWTEPDDWFTFLSLLQIRNWKERRNGNRK
jgi:hypothetical protein